MKLLIFYLFIIGKLILYSLNPFNVYIIQLLCLLIAYFIFKKSHATSDKPMKIDTYIIYILFLSLIFIFLYNILVHCLFSGVYTDFRESQYTNLDYFKLILLFPVFEELIYRKYLLQYLMTKYTDKKAIIYLSIGFAISHCFTDTGLLLVFLYSLFISFVYIKTRNIYICILSHSISNFMAVVFLPKFMMLIQQNNSMPNILITILLLFIMLFSLKKITSFDYKAAPPKATSIG